MQADLRLEPLSHTKYTSGLPFSTNREYVGSGFTTCLCKTKKGRFNRTLKDYLYINVLKDVALLNYQFENFKGLSETGNPMMRT